MKICSPQYGLNPMSTVGGEVYDRQILKHLASLGHEISIILPPNKKYDSKQKNWTVYYSSWRWFGKSYLYNIAIIPKLIHIYKKDPFEILRVHSPYYTGIGCWLFKTLFAPKVLLIVNYHHFENKFLWNIIDHFLMKKWDSIIVLSQYAKNFIIKKFHINKNNIKIIYPGISTQNTHHKTYNNEFRILFCGSLIKRKNISFIIYVLSIIKINNIKLRIIGSGRQQKLLKRLVNKLNLSNRITFLGNVSDSKKEREMASANLFVFPSLMEGFGLAPIEAMSHSTLAIASDRGALPETVGRGSITLPLDKKKWADTIVYFYNNPKKLLTWEQRVSKYANSFSWKKAGQILSEHMGKLQRQHKEIARLLFIHEYFPPYNVGGAEISMLNQAQVLARTGNFHITILTPNYGYGKNNEQIEKNIDIIRFPFPHKKKVPVSWLWHTNPFWHIWLTLFIIKTSLSKNIDIIHVHGLRSVSSAITARHFTRKPIVTSIRDYSSLCHFGFCLWTKNKKHTISEYLFKEMPFFMHNYAKKTSLFAWAKHVSSALLSLIINVHLRKQVKRSNHIVYISSYIKNVYNINGFYKTPSSIIYNIPPKYKKVSDEQIQIIKKLYKINKNKVLLYVGKISIGKGVTILLETFPNVLKYKKNITLVLIGEDTLKDSKKEKLLSLIDKENLIFINKIPHEDVNVWYKLADAVCIPSIWPEPFGRVIIEASLFGTPIVTSDNGALPELARHFSEVETIDIKNKDKFSKALIKALEKKKGYKRVISDESNIINQWTKLYKMLK